MSKTVTVLASIPWKDIAPEFAEIVLSDLDEEYDSFVRLSTPGFPNHYKRMRLVSVAFLMAKYVLHPPEQGAQGSQGGSYVDVWVNTPPDVKQYVYYYLLSEANTYLRVVPFMDENGLDLVKDRHLHTYNAFRAAAVALGWQDSSWAVAG